jgi:hypothetical protein
MNDWPRSSAAVSVAWLGDVMRRNGLLSAARITGVATADLGTGVGLMGEVVRLTLEYDRPSPQAPSTMIAKFPARERASIGKA